MLAALSLSLGACVDSAGRPLGLGSPSPGNQSNISYQAVFVGGSHACALVNGGNALCWGSAGDLGNGTNDASLTPVQVQYASFFRQLDLGSYSCGITTGFFGGQALCWGANVEGRLGDGTVEDRQIPRAVATSLFFTDIATGGAHTCALSTDEAAYCWGSNRFQQLLSHPDSLSLQPVDLLPGRTFREIDAGGLQTCVIDHADAVFCWGGAWGDLPARVIGAPAFAEFSVGQRHACGLTAEGAAFCFGENFDGQLGDGTFASTPEVLVAVDSELRFTAISAGTFHTCAVSEAGEAYCWGRDDLGQLGDGNPAGDPARKASPSRVVGFGPSVRLTSIAAGRFASCAITVDAVGYCWGSGTGNASQSSSTQAVLIGS